MPQAVHARLQQQPEVRQSLNTVYKLIRTEKSTPWLHVNHLVTFTLLATQKWTFTQAFKCSLRFKKRKSFFCCRISVFFLMVSYQMESIVELSLAFYRISCQLIPHLSRWRLEGQTLYTDIYFRDIFFKETKQATPSCLISELVRTKNASNCPVGDEMRWVTSNRWSVTVLTSPASPRWKDLVE